MRIMSFDLEEKRLKREIKKLKPKIVLLQLPEGLKPEAPHLASIIEEAGATPIVSTDPCYGACDLAISEAKILGADLIVHYGHAPMAMHTEISVVYVEAKAKISIKEAVTEALAYLESWSKIGLATTVQHVHQLDEAKSMLQNAGKTVFVGDADPVKYPGQVIGCDFVNARSVSEKVEAYLFVGGGRFHVMGVALATGKPTIVADPYERRAYPIQDEVRRVIKQRWANIAEAKDAKSFGVLISLKSGQMRLKDAMKIKEKLEQNGLKATLLALREVTSGALLQFPGIDAFVNTACPRLSLDDSQSFRKPLLSLNEALVLLGEMKWEELLRRGWFGNAT
ncbi:MAG TPA: diphthamide biosynthesis enzyme Dph2 [Candidatus Bathyarchaeota archaeon]|nr:diphthamide biosynthesis enzyme Dph2 [Candidatus Bathyarchaeota archaeon]